MIDRKILIRRLSFAAYFAAAFFIFLLLLFPYDRIKSRIESEVRLRTPLELSVARISPRFFNRFALIDVVVSDKTGRVLFKSPSVHTKVSLFGLLRGLLSVDLNAAAYGGELSVRARQGVNPQSLVLDADGLDISAYPLLKDFGLEVSGRLGGNFEMSGDAGKGRFLFKELAWRGLKVKGFPVPDLDFEQGWLEAELKGDRLTIRKMEMEGKELKIFTPEEGGAEQDKEDATHAGEATRGPPELGDPRWQSAMTYKLVGALSGLTEMKRHTYTALGIGLGIGFVTELIRKILKGAAAYKAFVKRDRTGFATDFMVVSVWGTDDNNSATDWDDFASGDPAANVKTAQRTILTNTGMLPNTMVCGRIVDDALTLHPDILDRIKYTQAATDAAIRGAIAAALGLQNYWPAESVYNSANEGAAMTGAAIIDDDALICVVNPSPAILNPSAGYSFQWPGGGGGGSIVPYREQSAKSDILQHSEAWDQKAVATDLGYFFADIV